MAVSEHYTILSCRPRERAVAFEVLFAEMQRGEGHAVLASKADDQSAGALGFLVWAYLALKDNHTDPSRIGTVYVAIGAGLATCMRAVDDELFEPV